MMYDTAPWNVRPTATMFQVHLMERGMVVGVRHYICDNLYR